MQHYLHSETQFSSSETGPSPQDVGNVLFPGTNNVLKLSFKKGVGGGGEPLL